MRDADQPALLADRRDRLDGRAGPGGTRSLEEDGDQVAVGRLDLLADDDRQPVRRGVAGAQRAVDPVVVRDREVRQAARRAAARTTAPGSASESKLALVWQCRSMKRPVGRSLGRCRPAGQAIRPAGRGTS